MTYTQKLKASKVILNAINRLRNDEYIVVTYGTDSGNQPVRYKIKAMFYSKSDNVLYSISKDDVWAMTGMNIETDKLGPINLGAYTFDMMGQRTTYKFPLYEMTLVEQPI